MPGKNGQLPNPDLDPEDGLGADVGVEYQPIPELLVSARGFMNTIDDAIVENVVSDALTIAVGQRRRDNRPGD